MSEERDDWLVAFAAGETKILGFSRNELLELRCKLNCRDQSMDEFLNNGE